MLRNFIEEIVDFIEEALKREEVWILIGLLLLSGFMVISFSQFSPQTTLRALFHFLTATWWLWFFLLFLPIVHSLWLYWRQALFKKGIEFVLLELKMPREVRKGPQGMEQILADIETLRNSPGNLVEKYWEGEVTRWFALEIISFGGEIHFYLRTFKKWKEIIEAAFFSYYPDVEISVVEDYVDKLPQNLSELYEKGFDIRGDELELTRESAYPIKTYPYFEKIEEERYFDPISNFLEILGSIKPGEFVGIQILIEPANYDWYKKWEGLVKKLRNAAEKESIESLPTVDKLPSSLQMIMSPGQNLILEAVENKLSKQAFNTLIRYIYLAPKKTINSDYAQRGIFGVFKQYVRYDMNAFKPNFNMRPSKSIIHPWRNLLVLTGIPFLYLRSRVECRKQRLLWNYLNRAMPPETKLGRIMEASLFHKHTSKLFELNIEEIATLFHPPTWVVLTAPHLQRAESRKTGPPSGIEIFGDEEELARFL